MAGGAFLEFNRELIAASASMLVLSILERGDTYGYEIIKKVSRLSNGALEWADGMLYPILHRLENKGHISSYWEKSKSGRKRKYYRITKRGLHSLRKEQESWKYMNRVLLEIWDVA